MRIVVWNCSMKLHAKWQYLQLLAPDIAIVPESASADILLKKMPLFLGTPPVWVGSNRNKGLAVFGFGKYEVHLAQCSQDDFPIHAPVVVTGPVPLHLLAVWSFSYLRPKTDRGPFLQALDTYADFLRNGPAVVAGDFNNHPRWDEPGKARSFANSTKQLSELGLTSAYHAYQSIAHGDESEPTLYFRSRKIDGPTYHIDYCFIPRSWRPALRDVTIGKFHEWGGLSDHMPLIVDLDENSLA